MLGSIFSRLGRVLNSSGHELELEEQNSYFGTMSSTSGKEISLKSIKIKGELESLLFSWRLEQEYVNETKDALEIIYTFPLGYKSALMGMKVKIGDKELEGIVIAKKEAEEKYEDAVSSGDTAIMVQERAFGLYTANLGNIAPGEKVVMSLHCAQMQAFDGDRIRISIPLLSGERYGDPYTPDGLSKYDSIETSLSAEYLFDTEISLKGELAKASVHCPGWDIKLTEEGDLKKLALQKPAKADRDFVLVLSDLPSRSTALYVPDKEQYMLSASFAPVFTKENPAPLDLKILVDCSGSMGGPRIQQARKGLGKILSLLQDDDKISLSRFGSDVHHETHGLHTCEQNYRRKLSALVDKLQANLGGTEMEGALLSVFNLDNESVCPVLLITDGDVWNIKNIVVSAERSGHKIFIIGVGSSPGETLLKSMAEKTGGACELVNAEENIGEAIVRMFKRMRGWQVKDISVDWEEKALWASPLPKSIYDGETVNMFALFAKEPQKAPILRWNSAEGPGSAQANELRKSENSDFVRMGRKIELGEIKKTKEKQELAIKYQLVTDLTSLILVMERAPELKFKSLPVTQKVPQMRANDNFMHAAFCCFSKMNLNDEVPTFLRMDDGSSSNFIEDRYDSGSRNLASKEANNEELTSQACAFWLENAAKGSDFQTIFQSFKKRRSFKKLINFVESLSESLSAEKLFAIFILWALEQNPDTERQLIRPARYEIREIPKEEIEKIKAKLEEWKNS